MGADGHLRVLRKHLDEPPRRQGGVAARALERIRPDAIAIERRPQLRREWHHHADDDRVHDPTLARGLQPQPVESGSRGCRHGGAGERAVRLDDGRVVGPDPAVAGTGGDVGVGVRDVDRELEPLPGHTELKPHGAAGPECAGDWRAGARRRRFVLAERRRQQAARQACRKQCHRQRQRAEHTPPQYGSSARRTGHRGMIPRLSALGTAANLSDGRST